ncbi:MAG: aminotransferase class V-fold PLP-dependent enzyme [Hyphomicrobiales bacterium]
MPLDIKFVRNQFPAFSEQSLQGQAFFENAGGSYTCRHVIDRLTRFYRETKVQPYAPYRASERAGAEMDSAHERLAGLFNVSADEVHFGPATSQNTYVLANAFRPGWAEGDEIIVTNQDHEANSGAWRRLADSGIIVKEWRVNKNTGELSPDDLDDLLTSRTRLVAFPHCSNIVGHINPVAEIAAKAHQAGAVTVVDGVSYAPHGLPDLQELGADIYLCSLYKVYGPHQGVMVVRRALLDKLANQSHYFSSEEVHRKLVPAGPDHAQVAAAGGVVDYFESLFRHHFGGGARQAEISRQVSGLMREHERALAVELLDFLSTRNDLRIVGSTDPVRRAPTVALDTFALAPADLAVRLAEKGIMTGAGDFYAPRVLEAVGIDPDRGVLRLSFVHYTNREEILKVISAMEQVLV